MRQLVLIALKLTVSVALLYFAISRMNFASIGDRLNHMELELGRGGNGDCAAADRRQRDPLAARWRWPAARHWRPGRRCGST